MTIALLAGYAESQNWPGIQGITTAHIEDYLLYVQTRPRWFGERSAGGSRSPSASYVETQYRRLKTFFRWLVDRGHIERNPIDLIPHPKVPERVIQTIDPADMLNLLELTNPKYGRTPREVFRMVRDQAVLYLLWDTPSRRDEITQLTLGQVHLDQGRILVMGKGRKERWMAFGASVAEKLWEYVRARRQLNPITDAFWVSDSGKAMQPGWLYQMLKRLGQRSGIHLHTHQFRHTYAVSQILAGMPTQVLEIEGGWKRIPETYLRTLNADHAAQFHRENSPADRLVRTQDAAKGRRSRSNGSQARGRL